MPQDSPQTKYSEQNVLNNVYEQALKALAVLTVGYDGVTSQIPLADSLAVKITESGSIKYIGLAAPGTAQSSATWQAFKVDKTTGTIITFADSNANFDNVATDLTALTYG